MIDQLQLYLGFYVLGNLDNFVVDDVGFRQCFGNFSQLYGERQVKFGDWLFVHGRHLDCGLQWVVCMGTLEQRLHRQLGRGKHKIGVYEQEVNGRIDECFFCLVDVGFCKVNWELKYGFAAKGAILANLQNFSAPSLPEEVSIDFEFARQFWIPLCYCLNWLQHRHIVLNSSESVQPKLKNHSAPPKLMLKIVHLLLVDLFRFLMASDVCAGGSFFPEDLSVPQIGCHLLTTHLRLSWSIVKPSRA